MLYIPECASALAHTLNIDPGSETFGLTDLGFDPQTLALVRIDARTLVGSKLPSSAHYEALHGSRRARIDAISTQLQQIVQWVRPIAVVSEAPFMSVRMPSAYGALMEVACAVREAVTAASPWTPLYWVDPPSVKNAVGAAGNADKDAVRRAVSRIPEIMAALVQPLEQLSEHAVDAIAVGYWQLQLYRQGRMPVI